MNKDSPPIKQDMNWGFWFQWTLASLAGWFAGTFVGQLVSSVAGMGSGLVIAGAVVGLGQWFILRRWVKGAGWWIVATAAGVAIAGIIGGVKVRVEILFPQSDQLPYLALQVTSLENVIIGGLIPGLVQWLALRQWVHRAGWWALGSAVAWAAGSIVVGLLVTDLPKNILRGGIDAYEAIVAGMSVTAILTGPLMLWLLRLPLPQAQISVDDRWGSFRGK